MLCYVLEKLVLLPVSFELLKEPFVQMVGASVYELRYHFFPATDSPHEYVYTTHLIGNIV